MLRDPKIEEELRSESKARRKVRGRRNGQSAISTLLEGRTLPAPEQHAIGPNEIPSAIGHPGAPEVKLIAFYLPQFHPVPENDQAWGPGFTEWNCVASARSYFDGHLQPQLPADLGFYDLRLPEIRERQAALAREYGIYGFCYHYYWFSGRRVLERPLEEILSSGKPDFPFCICWANESWSRRWDGSERELLIPQEHDLETDKRLIRDLLPILKDPRYICIDGAPLIVIYRAALLPSPHELFQSWRRTAAEHGIPGLHISMAETFGQQDPYLCGCDSAVEFPPHGLWSGSINDKIPGLDPHFSGTVYDFRDVVAAEMNRPRPSYLRFRGVMPGWDNTPRRGLGGNVFAHSSPEEYEVWLRAVVHEAAQRQSPDERLVFVNAWNEWGEGAHLEPDSRLGRSYLEATRKALFDQSDWRQVLDELEIRSEGRPELLSLAQSLRRRLLSFEIANRFLAEQVDAQVYHREEVTFREGILHEHLDLHQVGALGFVDGVNRFDPTKETPVIRRESPVLLKGWCYVPGQVLTADSPLFISLHNDVSGKVYCCSVRQRQERNDVVDYFETAPEEARWSGFTVTADMGAVESGSYRLAVNAVLPDRVCQCKLVREILVH